MVQKKKKQTCQCKVHTQGLKCPICGLFKINANSSNNSTDDDAELEEFFQKHIGIISDKKLCCQECGKPIYNPTKWNVAHILPKSKFKSVKTLDDNILYLCRTNRCHARFDSSWEAAKKMKVWPTALASVNRFASVIKEHHKILQHFIK